MIGGEKSLLAEEELGWECIAVLKHRHLQPCEIDLDTSLKLGKWSTEKVVVDQERHFS